MPIASSPGRNVGELTRPVPCPGSKVERGQIHTFTTHGPALTLRVSDRAICGIVRGFERIAIVREGQRSSAEAAWAMRSASVGPRQSSTRAVGHLLLES